MNDLIIMTVMLVLFGICLWFYYLKKRKTIDEEADREISSQTRECVEELEAERAKNEAVSSPEEPVGEKVAASFGEVVFGVKMLFCCGKRRQHVNVPRDGKAFSKTEEQVEEFNPQGAENENALLSVAEEEKLLTSKSVSADSSASVDVGGALSKELTETDLWNQWVAKTGDYHLSKEAIEAATWSLTFKQVLMLCERYQKLHPQLYSGICKYADWYERSDPAAQFVGLRMEALMKQCGILQRR